MPLQRAGRRPVDRHLRPDGGREGPDRRAARERAAALFEVDGRQRARRRLRASRASASATTASEHRARVRRRRRLRRLPRHLPAERSRTACCATFTREYPFGWLGILAEVAPSNDELVYAHHERGFALLCLRSPELSGYYVQCSPRRGHRRRGPTTGSGSELQRRTALDGWTLAEGPILEKGVTGMRSFVASRCSTAGSSSPATPRTSSRRPVRRGSTSRSGRAAARRGARRLVPDRQRGAARRLLRDVPASRLAGRALLVVDDLDAPPPPGGDPFDLSSSCLSSATSHRRSGRRERWRRTTSGSSSERRTEGGPWSST